MDEGVNTNFFPLPIEDFIMSVEELQNSPLHGLSAEIMLTELVEFYGWEILDAAVDLKCFRIKPTIPSCLTFLKKAEWARNRVEDFYLYCFKGMPKPSDEEAELKPRERGFPNGVVPKKPMALTLQKARAERAKVENEHAENKPEESSFRSKFSRPRF
jgi:uncharacterized protein (DUF2132 family)